MIRQISSAWDGQYHGSGRTVSPWLADEPARRPAPLAQNINVDVCVVGAGIAGLSAAYLLDRAGKRVAVLDDGEIGGGETSRTTAHLVTAIDDRYYELERMHGTERARLAAQSAVAAIDQVERIAAEEAIDCEFERLSGYLMLPEGDRDDLKLLERELKAARSAGLSGVELLQRAPIDDFECGPCLLFPHQAQFHPMKYLRGLARAVERDGGRIFTGTHASAIEGGEQAHVTTGAGPVVRAASIIIATNTPVNDRVAIHSKQAPYRTYVIAARVPRGSVQRALYWDGYWDERIPYHYVRLMRDESGAADDDPSRHELLIVGGEDHKTGQADDAEDRYARLEGWMRARFPAAREIVRVWSGQVMEPYDGLPFIGRNPMDAQNVFIATGDSGTGLTNGTIAGMLLSDLILERDNAWEEVFDPSRKRVRSAGEFARETVNFVAQYRDWLTSGEVPSEREIPAGSGAVIRHGLKKLAVYRDAAGILHEHSAVCPHLGCIVRWNSGEGTWDCPCHGSRFDCRGEVLNGPANGPLADAERTAAPAAPSASHDS